MWSKYKQLFFRIAVFAFLSLITPQVLLPNVRAFFRAQAIDATFDCVAGILFFVSGFVLASQVLFPLRTWKDRLWAVVSLFGWLINLHCPSTIVQDGKVGIGKEQVTVRGGLGWLPGVILVDGHSAAVTEKNLLFCRVLGPGTHFSQMGEQIPEEVNGWHPERVHNAVDLRRQIRFLSVRGLTRDGIYVKTRLYALFQIASDQDPTFQDFQKPYSYTDTAVYQVVYRERIGEKWDERYDWTEAPLTLAADCLRHLLSTYDLDELYGSCDSVVSLRKCISTVVANTIREPLRQRGVHLIHVGVTKIWPEDDSVIEQRVRYWQAGLQQQALFTEGQAQAEALRQIESARAQAQLQMIMGIVSGLQIVPQERRVDMVILRLLEAVECMAEDRATQSLLPEDILKTIQVWLGAARKNGGSAEGIPGIPGDGNSPSQQP